MADEKDDQKNRGKDGQHKQAALPAVSEIIQAFGGLRPMASKLEVAVSTVQGWSARDHIPENRHAEVRAAAARHGIVLVGANAGEAATSAAQKPVHAGTKERTTAVTPISAMKGKSGSVPSSGSKSQPSSSPCAPASSAAEKQSASPAKPAGAPSPTPTASPPTSARKNAGTLIPGALLGALLVAAGFAMALVSAPLWQPLLSDPDDSLVLEENLQALEDRLVVLERAPAPETNISLEQARALLDQMDAIQAQIQNSGDLSAIEQRLRELESASPAVTPGELDSLNGRLSVLENRLKEDLATRLAALEAQPPVATTSGDVILILAANELEEAVLAGLDHSRELALVRDLAGEDAGLAALLTPLTEAGSVIETRQGLAQDFADILPDIVAAGYGEAEEDGLLSGVLERLSRVVSVRPVGDVAGTGPDAVAARAEARLAEGDLLGAVVALESLEGKAAVAAAGWLAAAQTRLAAEKSLNDLIALLLSRRSESRGAAG